MSRREGGWSSEGYARKSTSSLVPPPPWILADKPINAHLHGQDYYCHPPKCEISQHQELGARGAGPALWSAR